MIAEYKHYWVKEGVPTLQDVIDAIDAAKKNNCNIFLNWKGPGYPWYRDTYKCEIHPDSNATEIYESLPKCYGV